MSNPSLPNFLTPYIRSINGKSLSAFVSKKKGYTLLIDLDDEFNGYSGLYINEKSQTALNHLGSEQYRFVRGVSLHATGFDNDGESVSSQTGFQEWVIENVFTLYHQEIANVVYELSQEHTKEQVYNVLREMSLLEADPYFKGMKNHPIIKVLSTIFQVHENQTYRPKDIEYIMEFFHECDEKYSLLEREGRELQFFALDFLPTPFPPIIQEYFANKTANELSRIMELSSESFLKEVERLTEYVLRLPLIRRIATHELLHKKCISTHIAHALAKGFIELPDESIPYIEIGLDLNPKDTSLLHLLHSIYENQGDLDKTRDIQDRLQALGSRPLSKGSIQEWEKEYKKLYRAFYYYDFFGKETTFADRIIDLEIQICTHWMNEIENSDSNPAQVIQTAIQNKGFPSSGSAIMMRRCVDKSLYDLCMQKMKILISDIDRCTLQYQCDPENFEELIVQGLKAALDSQDPRFLAEGWHMTSKISDIITTFKDVDLVYQFACIMGRTNRIDQAIAYTAQSLEMGMDWSHVVTDPDLENIHNHPDFLKLAPK